MMKRLFSLFLILCLCLPIFSGLQTEVRAAETLTYEDIIGAATVIKLNMD